MRKTLLIAVLGFTALALGRPSFAADTVFFEARGGFFWPSGQGFREAYKNGPEFGGEIGVSIVKNLSLWAGANYFSKTGQLSYTGEDVKIRVVPVFAGLRVRFVEARLAPYLGAAGGYFIYREESSVLGTASGGAFGFLGQFGLLLKLGGPASLDVHVRYTSASVKGEGDGTETSNIGGFSAGLGLRLSF